MLDCDACELVVCTLERLGLRPSAVDPGEESSVSIMEFHASISCWVNPISIAEAKENEWTMKMACRWLERTARRGNNSARRSKEDPVDAKWPKPNAKVSCNKHPLWFMCRFLV